MPDTQINWTEEYIAALPREDDRIERKGSGLLKDENRLREELGKQLSAFANSGGGIVILGVDNQGRIDGGIPIVHKGRQTTKEWLEDVLPHLTDLEILGVKVLDILAASAASKINPNCALYVIEIPDSDRAPHQCISDKRYYVRIGSKSLPAPHRVVEDIRNRTRHPLLEVAGFELQSLNCTSTQCSLGLVLTVKNTGKIISNHSCIGFRTDAASLHVGGISGCNIRAGSDSNSPLFEFTHALYPDMSVVLNLTLTLHGQLQVGSTNIPGSRNFFVDSSPISERAISLILYAESAPMKSRTFTISELEGGSATIQNAIIRYLHSQSQHRNIHTKNTWS